MTYRIRRGPFSCVFSIKSQKYLRNNQIDLMTHGSVFGEYHEFNA